MSSGEQTVGRERERARKVIKEEESEARAKALRLVSSYDPRIPNVCHETAVVITLSSLVKSQYLSLISIVGSAGLRSTEEDERA